MSGLDKLFSDEGKTPDQRRFDQARQEMLSAVSRIAARDAEHEGVDPASRWEEREIYPGGGFPRRQATPQYQLFAAMAMQRAAKVEIRNALSHARGRGTSWVEIAGWLGWSDAQEKYDMSAAAAGWRFAAAGVGPDEEMPAYSGYGYDGWTADWRCYSCGGTVHELHPDNGVADGERGHQSPCQRHDAEVAAERAKWDDADD